MELSANAVIEPREDGSCAFLRGKHRVLWVPPGREQIVLFRLEDPLRSPSIRDYQELQDLLSSGQIRKTSFPLPPYITDPAYQEKHKRILEKHWALIHPLVAEEDKFCLLVKKRLGAEIAAISKRLGVDRKIIYRDLYRYWQFGQTKFALLPHYGNCGSTNTGGPYEREAMKRGRKPKLITTGHVDTVLGTPFLKDHEPYVLTAVNAVYKHRSQPPWQKAWTYCMELLAEDGISPKISKAQFIYWGKKLTDWRQRERARKGQDHWARNLRALLGGADYGLFGPTGRYQIDATIADVYLVSRFNREWIIGRPVMYLVTDVFSGLIVGVYVGLEGPNWTGASLALYSAFTKKKAQCAYYDIDIEEDDWPAQHLCHTLSTDRGMEYLTDALLKALELLDIGMEALPAYRPDLKGLVENAFHLLNGEIKHIPGAVRQRERERNARDYRLDAVLDLHQFTRIILANCLRLNLIRFRDPFQSLQLPARALAADHIDMCPLEIFKWGIEEALGSPRPIDEDLENLVRGALMWKSRASVTERGIRLHKMYYTCAQAEDEHWFVKARQSRWEIALYHDKGSTLAPWYRDTRTGRFEPCRLLHGDAFYAQLRMDEVEDMVEYLDLLERERQYKIGEAVAKYATVTARTLVEAGATRPNLAGLPKSQRVAAIRENQTREKRLEQALRDMALSVTASSGGGKGGKPALVDETDPYLKAMLLEIRETCC